MSITNTNPDPVRGAKCLLLISSLAVIVLIAGSAKTSLFTEWRHHQREYRELLMAKAGDDAARQSAAAYRVAIQQVVVPELGKTDRCISCHTGIDDPRMAREKQPFRTHPGTILGDHPLSKFGCTVCHRGQGLATTDADAKAVHSFWDYPMLPGKMAQSSCGQCHDPAWTAERGGEVLAAGAILFEQRGCRSCHKLGGRGGSLGIALDDEGRKVIHQFALTNLKGEHTIWNWLEEHFRDPAGVVAGSQMRHPALTSPEIEQLTTFVLSLSTETMPNEYIANDKVAQKYAALQPGKPNGAELYRQFCFSCHESGAYSRWDRIQKRFIPAVRGRALAVSPAEFLVSQIREGRERTQMPGWHKQAGGLTDGEILALESYLRGGNKPGRFAAQPGRAGDQGRGRKYYAQNCQGCHGADGKGGIAPSLASPTFRRSASDAFILATIRGGRPDTAMPAFQQAGKAGLSEIELADLLAYIRSMR